MKKVTREQLLYWVGDDNQTESLIKLLLEIANFEYDSEGLRDDVLNHWSDNENI